MFFLKKVFRRRKKKAEREDSQMAIDNLKEMETLILRKQLFLEEKIQKIGVFFNSIYDLSLSGTRNSEKTSKKQQEAGFIRPQEEENPRKRID